jgi:hypothetical protein
MRSLGEVAFRLRQEVSNLFLLARPPRLPKAFPAPSVPRSPIISVPAEGEVARLAQTIRSHKIPLFDREFDFDPPIHWRRDAISGRETPPNYFRSIRYLDSQEAGDHKIIWELNRHQHLVLLAQAGDEASLRTLFAELESWITQNPFQRGINWASALEVAFRALSWIQIYQHAGMCMTPEFRQQFLQNLYRHGRHLEANLSIYFSPNTHLLGEAVALHALGALFPDFPRAARWEETGRSWVSNEYVRQVRADGSHFEQSSYYQVYALDMFLFHASLAGASAEERTILGRMAGFLEALLGPNGELPFLGDDDGGRLFYPYGPRALFAQDTLRTANTFLGRAPGQPRSQLFEDAGVAVMRSGDRHIVIDAGPFGPGRAGHSHSDTLSMVVGAGGERLLIDPGTFTYVGDPVWREYFRSASAHNTVRVGGREQALPAGPFWWKDPPRVRVLEWSASEARDTLVAECAYGDFVHRRRVVFEKPHRLIITDDVDGPPGEHLVEQFWHAGSINAIRHLIVEGGIQREAWRSSCFGNKHLGPVVVVEKRTSLPCRLTAGLEF